MPNGYSRPQIRLHWIIAVLVAAQFMFGDGIATAWDGLGAGETAPFDPTVPMHVAGGLLILGLALWRLALRFGRGVPEAPATGGRAMQRAAALVHGAFYVLLIGLPLGGMAAWFGGLEIAAQLHEALTTVLLVLVVLHVAAALWHHVALRDGLLRRMTRPED